MKCILIHKSNPLHTQLQDTLVKNGHDITVLDYTGATTGYELYQTVAAADPDRVFTLDLAGFNILTDTDDIAYVNLSCPNAHILCKPFSPAELACLGGKLSLAMFFYCFAPETYNHLAAHCPDIPYLKHVAGFAEALADWEAELR
ncbi:MAG: hypothetical protein LBI54_10790 [Lachnospiraceae bacterium]|jgi:hypothetical protein|nr:hypothetical protein [Lachnospiraceae bacterium]